MEFYRIMIFYDPKYRIKSLGTTKYGNLKIHVIKKKRISGWFLPPWSLGLACGSSLVPSGHSKKWIELSLSSDTK
jgi:hypothetical protein